MFKEIFTLPLGDSIQGCILKIVSELRLYLVQYVLITRKKFWEAESLGSWSHFWQKLTYLISENRYFRQNCGQGKSGNDCSLCIKNTKITGDMYFYVFFHIRVGGTLENYSGPPFWGVKAPLFWFLFNYLKNIRDTKNICKQKL